MTLPPKPSDKRWYREPWPWLLMAGPGLVIVAGSVTAWLAFSGADGLVADDYYKQGLMINRTLAREAQARALRLGGEIAVQGGLVRVILESSATMPDRVALRFAHPVRAGEDRLIYLARREGNAYEAPIAPLAPVPWLAILETPDWRLSAVLDPRKNAPARLEPGIR